MKTVVFVFLCILFSTNVVTGQKSILGIWDTTKGTTLVEIKGSEGKVISSDKLEAGTLLLRDITSENGKWKAKLFNVKKKKWYEAVLKNEDEKLLITVGAGLVGKTIEWTKV
ncbi:hypothetical protein ACOKFD_13780 [Flagellimonas sp. S174]|uniref:hypothetical protein n=1 Tax=Flagellimonas sp. S174 TaxID=3410790 RepID=UPI003BF4BC1B